MQPLRHFPPGSEELPAHHRAQQHHQRRQNLPGENEGWEHVWPGENSLGKRMRGFHPFSSGFPLLGKSCFAIWVKTGPKNTVQDHAPACEWGNSFSALVSAPLTR